MSLLEKITPMIKGALPPAEYEVMEVQPRRSEDKFYYLAGSEGMIAPLTSQFLALHEMVQGSQLNLEDWIEKFENCFPSIENFSSLDFQNKPEPWGRPYKDRPRIFIRYSENGYYACEMFPDGNENSDFSQLLFGGAKEIIAQAMNCMALSRNLDYYDIGGILGYPVNEYFKMFPTEGISLHFRLKTKIQSYTESVLYKNVRVPKVDINKLDYSKLWNACGGDTGLDFGPISANQKIGPAQISKDVKNLSLIVAKGPTDDKAKENVLRFLDFSLFEAKKLFYSKEDSEEGLSYKVFPCSVSFLITKIEQNASASTKGQETYAGKKTTNKTRILMRNSKKPPQFDFILEQLEEAMRN